MSTRRSAPNLGRFRDEERGAVVMIVAISLLALLGMLVLVFDLGHAVAIKRNMVNASDSAVLAAARECAEGHGEGSARAAAAELATQNYASSTITTFSAPQCEALSSDGLKFVTVGTTADVEYYFAQIFGFDSGPVVAQAKAAWGPLVSVMSPVPIRIALDALISCTAQSPGSSGPACAFAFDNDPVQSQWGILNFPEGWPTTGTGPPACSNSGGQGDVNGYITGSGPPFTATVPEDPGYVYVCATPGARSDTMNVLMDMIAATAPDPFALTFPVMTSEQPIMDLGGNQQAVPIVGFTVLQVLGAWFGHDADGHCTFPAGTRNNSKFCIQTQWNGEQIVSGGVPGSGLSYGSLGIRLVD